MESRKWWLVVILLMLLVPAYTSAEEKICDSYQDCASKAEALTGKGDLTDEEGKQYQDLYLHASEYTPKGSGDYYYALARSGVYGENSAEDPVMTDNLKLAVLAGRKDFDTVLWLAYRLSGSGNCTQAQRHLDEFPPRNQTEIEKLSEFYRISPCKNTKKRLNLAFQLLDMKLASGSLQQGDCFMLYCHEYSDEFAFRDEVGAYLDSRIKKYGHPLLYQIRIYNSLHEGKHKQALVDIEKAPKKKMNDIDVFMFQTYKIQALSGLGQYRQALKIADQLVKEERDGTSFSTRVDRADLFVKLGEHQYAKKDLIIACDNKAFQACDKLEEFKKDEMRGWQWKKFSENDLGEKLYYDRSGVKKNKQVTSAWVLYEGENSRTKFVQLDCRQHTVNLVGSDAKAKWSPIDPQSVFESLQKEICK